MRLTDLQPRDPDAAGRTLAVLCFIASGVTVAFTVAGAEISPAMTVASYVVAALMSVLGVLLLTAPPRARAWLYLPTPLLALAGITLLDLGTRDATATGQIFFSLPVLYAGSQLKPLATWITAVCAVGCVTVVAWSILPSALAASDTLFVSTTMLLMAWVLSRAGQRTDRLVARLEAQAAVDPLTGLVTRRVLDDAAQSVLDSVDGHGGTALVLLDVDRFKTINDTYGHPVGDAALTHIAEVLRRRCRPDTVISRLGGDELAVLLPGCPHEVAVRRAEELLEAVASQPLLLPSLETIRLSVSVGVAHAAVPGTALHDLYAAADSALYTSKRNGRGRVTASTSGAPVS